MTYFLLTASMLWFNSPVMPDSCGLTVVECYGENVEDYIRTEFNKAGLDGERAVKIAWLESKFKTDAVGYNRNGSNDKGVWQINSIHGLSDDCRFSLECSTTWAIEKVKKDKGFTAWSANKLIK